MCFLSRVLIILEVAISDRAFFSSHCSCKGHLFRLSCVYYKVNIVRTYAVEHKIKIGSLI